MDEIAIHHNDPSALTRGHVGCDDLWYLMTGQFADKCVPVSAVQQVVYNSGRWRHESGAGGGRQRERAAALQRLELSRRLQGCDEGWEIVFAGRAFDIIGCLAAAAGPLDRPAILRSLGQNHGINYMDDAIRRLDIGGDDIGAVDHDAVTERDSQRLAVHGLGHHAV